MSPVAAPTLTRHVAAIVLGWQNSEDGWRPSFGESALIAAAFSLDRDTARECLPGGLCDAVDLWRSGGADALRAAMEDAA